MSNGFILVLLFVFKSNPLACRRRSASFLGLLSILTLFFGMAVTIFLCAGAHLVYVCVMSAFCPFCNMICT